MWVVTVYRIPSMSDIVSYECPNLSTLRDLEECLQKTLDFDKYDYEYYKQSEHSKSF